MVVSSEPTWGGYRTLPPLILELTSTNPAVPSLCGGAGFVTGGKDFAGGATLEWTPILDSSNEYLDSNAVSGWVVSPEISTDDNPFLHPFGGDWECYVAPDVQHTSLLAPTNFVPDSPPSGTWAGGLYAAAAQAAKSAGYPHLTFCGQPGYGVLGVEFDSGLIPEPYRAMQGDRIVAYGRWIVDAGHDDFHTEIHTPLVLAWARQLESASPGSPGDVERAIDQGGVGSTFAGASTFSRIISRPFFVSQLFGGEGFVQHLIDQAENPLTDLGSIFQVDSWDAQATVWPYPFMGDHSINFVLRPPSTRPNPGSRLGVSGHLTVRQGVTVALALSGDGGLSVTIQLKQADPCQPEEMAVMATESSISHMQTHSAQPGKLSPGQLQQIAKWSKALQTAQAQLQACRAQNPPTCQTSALPASHQLQMTLLQAIDLFDETAGMIAFIAGILSVVGAAIESIPITYISCDPIPDPQPTNASNAKDTIWGVPVDSLPAGAGVTVTVANDQPFPIYGWLNVGWLPPVSPVPSGK